MSVVRLGAHVPIESSDRATSNDRLEVRNGGLRHCCGGGGELVENGRVIPDALEGGIVGDAKARMEQSEGTRLSTEHSEARERAERD